MLALQTVSDFFGCLRNLALDGCNVFKIFDGTPSLIYGYTTHTKPEAPYVFKKKWTADISKEDMEELKNCILKAVSDNYQIKVCVLAKSQKGLRIRFDNETAWLSDKEKLLHSIEKKIFDNYVVPKFDNRYVVPKFDNYVVPNTPVIKSEKSEKSIKEKKKMNDFSLTNLKDAFINKITHLDRKTVMILAIIALILLIVGKYTTIKEIFVGIKDKIKRSKNFKAMVEDGTNAVNSLKKIVGVKSGDNNEN